MGRPIERVWLGLEIGTQGVRAAAFDANGVRLGAGKAPRPPRSPEAGAMIHLPDLDWWEGAREALVQALSGIRPQRIAGVGLAGLFPAVCLVGPDGRARTPGILYGDQRTLTATDFVEERLAGEDLDGDEVSPRLVELLRTLPQAALDDSLALGPAGYLGLRLTGVPSIDPHSASRWGGLVGSGGRSWDTGAATSLGIPASTLPRIVAPGRMLGATTADAASATGIPAGVPVVAATTDSLATMLGAGVVRSGDALAYYGSTGTLLLVTMDLEQALAQPEAHGAATPYRRVAHATGSGLFAQFVRRELLGGVDHETLNAEAATVSAGSEGVLVVPYLSGRLLPTPAPGLRAGIAGIGIGHHRGHVWRAVLEAFGWVLMGAQQDGQSRASEIQRVTAAGGGARSKVWRDIVSDMTGWPQLVAPTDATVRGAAFLAAQALSGPSFGELAERWLADQVDGTAADRAPDHAATERYRALLPAWTRLVEAFVALGEQAR